MRAWWLLQTTVWCCPYLRWPEHGRGCLSGAPVGYCIAAGAVNGVGVGIGSLPWGDYGAPEAEGLATVVGDFLGIWPGVIADCDRGGG